MKRTGARVAAVVAAVALMGAAYTLGVFEQVRDPGHLRDTLVGLGGWGYAAFIISYTLLQPFGVPGTVFVMAAPLIWPWPVAFALSMVGTLGASVVGFSFARFVARDWISSKIPERFRKYEDALERRGFATVVTLRFLFWMPPLLHAFFGVSKVRFWTHFWGSAVGYLVPLFLTSFFGQKLFDAMRTAPPWAWAATAGAIVASVVVWLLVLRVRAKGRGASV